MFLDFNVQGTAQDHLRMEPVSEYKSLEFVWQSPSLPSSEKLIYLHVSDPR